MRSIQYFTLSLSILYLQASISQVQELQPGLHEPPTLSAGYSTIPAHWKQSTPLLATSQRISPTRRGTITSPYSLRAIGHWNGWHNVRYIFSFGDSYTSTGFDVNGTQPDKARPLGNPNYPGKTSANGPNYVDFLTVIYNRSFIETHNMGFGGATINNSIIASAFGQRVKSFRDQVIEEFQPRYVRIKPVTWTPDNSLFIIFFGINDALQSYSAARNDTLQYNAIKSYDCIVNQLYVDGARNFLFLNVPPIDRAPIALDFGGGQREALADWIARFNFRLGALAWNFAARKHATTVFQLDTETLFTQVLNNPKQFPETARYRNTTDYCVAYRNGTAEYDSYNPICGFPVQEYLWLNTLHPTSTLHNFMGSQISQLLQS